MKRIRDTGRSHRLWRALIAPNLAGVRVTVTVENATPDFMSQVVFQSTSDGAVWDAPIAMEPAPVGDNREFTTDWYTTTNNFKRGIRLGVLASHAAAKQKAKEAKDDGLWFLWYGIARRLFEEIWSEVGKQRMCCGGR